MYTNIISAIHKYFQTQHFNKIIISEVIKKRVFTNTNYRRLIEQNVKLGNILFALWTNKYK